MARNFVLRVKRGHCKAKVAAVAILTRARMIKARRLQVGGEDFYLVDVVHVGAKCRGCQSVEFGRL